MAVTEVLPDAERVLLIVLELTIVPVFVFDTEGLAEADLVPEGEAVSVPDPRRLFDTLVELEGRVDAVEDNERRDDDVGDTETVDDHVPLGDNETVLLLLTVRDTVDVALLVLDLRGVREMALVGEPERDNPGEREAVMLRVVVDEGTALKVDVGVRESDFVEEDDAVPVLDLVAVDVATMGLRARCRRDPPNSPLSTDPTFSTSGASPLRSEADSWPSVRRFRRSARRIDCGSSRLASRRRAASATTAATEPSSSAVAAAAEARSARRIEGPSTFCGDAKPTPSKTMKKQNAKRIG